MAEPTDPSSIGYYEFINNEEGDERSLDGEGALFIFNGDGTLDSDSWWRRAIKFRNLPLEEGKFYRLDFKLKGSKRYDYIGLEGDNRPLCKASAQLLQGEYEDGYNISLLDYNGAEQRGEFQDFNEDDYESYFKTFIFASEQQQKDAYEALDKGELADKFSLSISVFNPGMFYLKDVVLSEVSAVVSAEFGLSAIKIGFVSNTNIATMANANPAGLVFFDVLTYAQVLADNVSVPVKSIEYHKDGFLYIFTEENGLSGASDVSVSFTNPTDDKLIKMNGKIESTASIFDFKDYEATYNAALNDVSPCPTYSVSLANDTEDADNWTIKPTIATTTGVPAGTTVTATYKGTKKVKSVKVVKKASAVPSSASH